MLVRDLECRQRGEKSHTELKNTKQALNHKSKPAKKTSAVWRNKTEHEEAGSNGQQFSLLVDALYKEKLKHLPLMPTKIFLKTYIGKSVRMMGRAEVNVKLNEQTVITVCGERQLPSFSWMVMDGEDPVKLGRYIASQQKKLV
ncbi:hypothetical protein scyTo_0014425 [Scyliorhinus torazame]|uniref:Uncharacterized protein n=1 Tax=Scyliorhinus torazame TaxID=75743 RepID=A0A401NMC2_SCYTO|nr:hypothetical protein [Scyliorhinus torazame]